MLTEIKNVKDLLLNDQKLHNTLDSWVMGNCIPEDHIDHLLAHFKMRKMRNRVFRANLFSNGKYHENTYRVVSASTSIIGAARGASSMMIESMSIDPGLECEVHVFDLGVDVNVVISPSQFKSILEVLGYASHFYQERELIIHNPNQIHTKFNLVRKFSHEQAHALVEKSKP